MDSSDHESVGHRSQSPQRYGGSLGREDLIVKVQRRRSSDSALLTHARWNHPLDILNHCILFASQGILRCLLSFLPTSCMHLHHGMTQQVMTSYLAQYLRLSHLASMR